MRPSPRPGRVRSLLLSAAGVALIIAVVAGGLAFTSRDAPAAERLDYSLISPRVGPLDATVEASGAIQARETRSVAFTTSGLIAEVLVRVGDQVAAGAPLARLDDRELALRVRQAEAQLAQAQAGRDRLLVGASPADLAAAEAQLEQARANLRQVSGNVTAQDLAAARAQLEQARAALSRLLAGPRAPDVAAAEAQLEQARAGLQAQRDSLSAAKSRAESQLEQAANALRDAQASYSNLYWQNRQLADQLGQFGRELPQEARDREEAALRAVQNAEEGLRQAQLAVEQARNAEVNGLASAQAQVEQAQAGLDKLLAGAEADQLAAARAQVAQAEASLSRLQGDQRAGSLAAAQAGVAGAEANLSRLGTPPQAADLASAQAQILSAEASLEQARLALERATLTAPIAGTVAEVRLKAGELFSAGQAAVVIADLSSFYVDVTVDEIDVAQIAVDQPVRLSLDALPGLSPEGRVERINPLAIPGATVTSYNVRIATDAAADKIRPGMSAAADIVVARKDEALLVPRRAVRAEQGRFFVDTVADQALCAADRATWPEAPELVAVEVTTGLGNEQVIEIASGPVELSSCIYVKGVDARLEVFSGPPPGVRR